MPLHDTTSSDALFKQCTKCKEWKPATTEYFHRTKGIACGLMARCKACRSTQKPSTIKEGYKRCPRCKEEKPATLDYFATDRRRISGLTVWCKTCRLDAQRQRRAKYPERTKELARIAHLKWVAKNPTWLREYRRKNPSHRSEVRKQNIQKKREVDPDYGKASAVIFTQRRRARKSKLPATLTHEQWQRALDYFDHSCAVCGRPMNGLFHCAAADHWIALSDPLCPGSVATNVVPLCHGVNGCNNYKHKKPPREWLTEQFGKRKAQVILQRIDEYFSWVREQDNH